MKKLALTIIFIIITFINAFSQGTTTLADEFATTIKIAGRYVPGSGIELRYFPEKRVVMETGFRSGFIIERSMAGENEFVEIARLLPFDDAQWDQIMEGVTGEALDLLDLARSYLDVALTPKGGTFDFETGISDMRRQRGDEDFEHAIFMLTAAREARAAQALAMSYTDQNVIEGQSYTYRIRTVNEPPIYTLVPEPITIEARVDDHSFENEVFFYEGDTWINFVWEEDGRLSLYEVERMDPGTGTFILLTDAPRINLGGRDFDGFQRSTFRDEELENYQLYTYRFYGHTVFGERILFAKVEAMPRDRTPPEAPRLLTLEHQAPREVLLEWEMNDPPAADLMGFVVGRAPQPDEGFEIIHPELLPKDTRSFTDTTFIEGLLNYYVIQAVDTAFNVSSSIPAAVTLIDTIPPTKPVFLSGSIDSLGVVTLEVIRNSEPDLMGYRLFRANHPDHEFSVIFEYFADKDSLPSTQMQQNPSPLFDNPVVFTDTVTLNSLTPHIYYRVKALDFNFNQSAFSDMMVIERPDTIPPSTPVFKRVVNRTTEVELHFALSESPDVRAHSLYRITSMEAPWELLAMLDEGQTSYTDREAEQGVTYYYSIRAVDNSGNYSDYAFPVQGIVYDDGVRPVVESLQISVVEDRAVISWQYDHMAINDFFVVFRSDDQGRMRQFRSTSSTSLEIPSQEAENHLFAVKAFTADGGESPLSERVGL